MAEPRKPRVTTKTNVAKTPVEKAPEAETPAPKAAAKPRRKPTAPKPKVEPVVDETTTNDTPPAVEELEETVFIEEPTIARQVAPEDIAASLSETNVKDRLGSGDYESLTTLKDTQKLDTTTVNYYPLSVWTRSSKTLDRLANISFDRIVRDVGTPNDQLVVDLNNQNKVNDDPFMFSFSARAGARWANYLEVEDKRKLRSSRISFQTSRNGVSIGEDDRKLQSVLFARLELGTPRLVRLWHSGLIFAIRPINKATRIRMVERLNNAHLETLRDTNGVIHGTSSYYTNRIIMEEFMANVEDANIDSSYWDSIAKYVDHRDIQVMANQLMAGSYQRGYNFIDHCGGIKVTKTDDGKERKTLCGHITRAVLDFSLLEIIDNNMFTDWQREFIRKPLTAQKESIDDILKYQTLGAMHEREVHNIQEGIEVILKAPKADVHIRLGEMWIESVEEALERTISSDSSDEVRNEFISRQLEATAALDVAHWVDGFIIDGEEISKPAVVEATFIQLSNNEDLRNEVFELIRKTIAKRLAAVIALPTHRCPECKNLSSEINNNGNIIYTPIDAVSRFFILAARNP